MKVALSHLGILKYDNYVKSITGLDDNGLPLLKCPSTPHLKQIMEPGLFVEEEDIFSTARLS